MGLGLKVAPDERDYSLLAETRNALRQREGATREIAMRTGGSASAG